MREPNNLKTTNGVLAQTAARTNLRAVRDDVERQEILRALEEANWIVSGPSGAAARLGTKRSTLQFRMRRLGIVRTSGQAQKVGEPK